MKVQSLLRTPRLGILITLLALVTMLLLAVGTSAHAASTRDSANIPFAGAPITHIIRGPVFNPTSLQIFLQHTNSIEVINDTNAEKVVLDASGHVVMRLAPHASQFLTFSATGTYVYHLKAHPKATFTAIVN